MRIVYSMGSWNPAYGGPFFSVGALSAALAARGAGAHIIAGEFPNLPTEAPPPAVQLHTIAGRRFPLVGQVWSPQLKPRLNELIDIIQPQVIHENGLWLSLNHGVAQVTAKRGIPRMLSPRGTLDPWALQYRGWKKRLALALYQRKDLERVDCFHAASQQEADNIRAFGLQQPIALIPNGAAIPAQSAHFRLASGEGASKIQNPEFVSNDPASDRSALRTALYLGRLHPIKNLSNLIRAWALVKPEGWCLKLVGTNEGGHRQALKALAESLGIAKQVIFLEPLYGAEKAKLLSDAQCLCLVSKSENFGITIAEAMAAGLPVVASKDTPWQCLESAQAGWWVDGDVRSLSAAFKIVTNSSSHELQIIGARGRDYAQQNFSWERIAGEFQAVYKWMAVGGERPPCIQ